MNVKAGLLFGLVLGLPTVAHAQEAAVADQPDAADGEIVVTAQRRSETLTDVPIAITVKMAAQLTEAGVVSVRDLANVTPGLRFGTSVNALPTIRGIFSRQTDPGNDPNVALYVDGIYQANVIANNFDLVDVDRVEVLKGPQGTLFGRNATGGAIRIFTKSPSFEESGSFDIGYGNYNAVKMQGYFTRPIVGDTLAGSVVIGFDDSDGYDFDILAGRRTAGLTARSARGKLLFKPSSALEATLILGYADRRNSNLEGWNALGGNSAGRRVAGAAIPTDPHRIAPNVDPYQQSTAYTAALDVSLDTGLGTLTSLTAYSDTAYTTNQDGDFSGANLLNFRIDVDQKDVQQELNFVSKPIGIVGMSAGLFYYHSDGRYDPLRIFGATSDLYGFMQQKTRAYAAYGELTIEPVARLTLIGGLRYSKERREASGLYKATSAPPATLPPIGERSFDAFTPRASIRYELPSGDNAYFTYSQGFKSGGFNIAGLARTPFEPERLTSYEFGVKTAPSRVLAANISVFRYNYANQQVQAFVNNLNVTANAANSRIYGIDADVTVRPARAITLVGGISYLHAEYRSFPGAVINVPTGTPPCLCGNTTITGDLSGRRLPDAPRFTVSGTASYRKDIAAGRVELSASAYRTSGYFVDTGLRVWQPEYTTLSARAAFQPAGTDLTLYVWGRNLTDENYLAAAFIASAGDGVIWSTPRTYGAGAKFAF